MKYIIYILLMFLSCTCASAQTQNNGTKAPQAAQRKPAVNHKFSSKEYIEHKNRFLTKNAQLSQSEATEVLELLHQQKELQRANDRKIRELRKEVNTNPDEATSLSILKQIRSLQENSYKVELDYQKKLLKIIPTQKYLRLINADAAFDRDMLHKMMAPHKGNQAKAPKAPNGNAPATPKAPKAQNGNAPATPKK